MKSNPWIWLQPTLTYTLVWIHIMLVGLCFITIIFLKNHKYLKFSHLSFTIDEWELIFPCLLRVKMHWFLVYTQGKDTTIVSNWLWMLCSRFFFCPPSNLLTSNLWTWATNAFEACLQQRRLPFCYTPNVRLIWALPNDKVTNHYSNVCIFSEPSCWSSANSCYD
jgi:hypothetical protein